MDSYPTKFYHVHGFDSREHLESYFSGKKEMAFRDDTLKFPMEQLHRAFSKGNIKGDLLIDISHGSFIHLLYSASGFFKQICVLKCAENCIMEVNRWINKCTGAFDWSHLFDFIKDLEGNCDQFQGEDITKKIAIADIKKCDFEKENITDPEVLPLADCLITAGILELISKDQCEYRMNFKKIIKLLKPEGHLIMIGTLNTTYCMVGQEKVHVFKYDEDFAKQVLTDEGFIIDHMAVHKRTVVSDLTDYDAFLFTKAHRGAWF